MEPVFFTNPTEMRQWFDNHHLQANELWAGYYKKETGKPSITWSESVDEALCFGWIDGIRKSLDTERYVIRFTPRNPKSNWSAINIKKVETLKQKGLMKPEGLYIYEKREKSRSKVYSYENNPETLDPEFEKQFIANEEAWTFFQAQAPSYRKVATRWVMTAKQETTKRSRLQTLISDCSKGKKIKPLNYGPKSNPND